MAAGSGLKPLRKTVSPRCIMCALKRIPPTSLVVATGASRFGCMTFAAYRKNGAANPAQSPLEQ